MTKPSVELVKMGMWVDRNSGVLSPQEMMARFVEVFPGATIADLKAALVLAQRATNDRIAANTEERELRLAELRRRGEAPEGPAEP